MGKTKESSKLKALEQFATSFQADFRFSPLNIMVLMALCLTGLGLHFCVFPFNLQAVVTIMVLALGLSLFIRISQIWEAVLVLTALAALGVYLRHRPESLILVSFITLAGLILLLPKNIVVSH